MVSMVFSLYQLVFGHIPKFPYIDGFTDQFHSGSSSMYASLRRAHIRAENNAKPHQVLILQASGNRATIFSILVVVSILRETTGRNEKALEK